MTVDMQGFVLSELFWARLSWAGLLWPCFGGRWHSKLRKFLFSGGPLPIPALRHSPTANLGANTLESKLGCTSYVPAQEANLVYKIKRDICSIFWKYSRVSVNKGCETWWGCIGKLEVLHRIPDSDYAQTVSEQITNFSKPEPLLCTW